MMTFPLIFLFRVTRRHVGLLVLGSVLLLAQGCSPKAADAAVGNKSAVTIVRETKAEFPDKTIALYRELQQRCMEGRAVVAAGQGWAYNPATDAITDVEILALNTQKTEEYFDGAKYAITTTGTRYDGKNYGVTQESNCKMLSEPFKTVEIHDGDCHSMKVDYDLPESTGRRSEFKFKDVCNKYSSQILDQGGDTVTVAGTGQHCKWNKPDGDPKHIATCTLLPDPLHAGTGRELVAIRKSVEAIRVSDQPLFGTVANTMQAQATIEQATRIDVGGAIPAAKFEFPADSASFPLEKIN